MIGKRIFLKIDDREFLLNFNNNIYSNYIKNEIIESADNIYLKVLEIETRLKKKNGMSSISFQKKPLLKKMKALKRVEQVLVLQIMTKTLMIKLMIMNKFFN